MLSLWTFGWVPLGSRSLHRLVSSFDLSAPPQSAKRHQRVAMFGRPQIIPNWFEEPIALFLLLTWFSDECQTSLQSIDWINSLLIKLYNFTLCFYSESLTTYRSILTNTQVVDKITTRIIDSRITHVQLLDLQSVWTALSIDWHRPSRWLSR